MDIREIQQAIDVFTKHRTEILKAARLGDEGQRVLAEVDNEGNWCGIRLVDPNTGSALEHKDEGYALFVDCNPFISRKNVSTIIYDWEDERFAELREREGIDVDVEYPRRDYRGFDDDLFSRGR